MNTSDKVDAIRKKAATILDSTSQSDTWDDDWNRLRSFYSLPDVLRKYSQMVEIASMMMLQQIIPEILRNEYDDITIDANYFPATGCDITVNLSGSPFMKMEVWNWWIHSVATQKRTIEVKNNLAGVEFKYLFVPTPLNFQSIYKSLVPATLSILKGVHVYYAGSQILPQTYWDYFNDAHTSFTLFRSVSGSNTTIYQKNRLTKFFKETGLISLI
jgi:hypothetical protein